MRPEGNWFVKWRARQCVASRSDKAANKVFLSKLPKAEECFGWPMTWRRDENEEGESIRKSHD